jgi:hypothetical protein
MYWVFGNVSRHLFPHVYNEMTAASLKMLCFLVPTYNNMLNTIKKIKINSATTQINGTKHRDTPSRTIVNAFQTFALALNTF